MNFWSLKIAVVGALIFVALQFVIQLSAVLLARYTGSVGIDTSRPMLFVLYLGMWVLSFAIAYSIFPRFGRT
jgi:hypothetical protein